MAWPPARVMLVTVGSVYLAAAAAGLAGIGVEALGRLGITIGGPLLAWHLTMGILCAGSGIIASSREGALTASRWLIAAHLLAAFWGLIIIYTVPMTVVDELLLIGTAALLWIGLRASHPTPPRGYERAHPR